MPDPSLTSARFDVVAAAWQKLNPEDAPSITLDALKAGYDASRHPRVLDGTMAIGQAKNVVAHHFDTVPDGVVTWNEFLQFHVKMSLEVDRSRALDRDSTFTMLVTQMWKLDEEEERALHPTRIFPITMSAPTGLLATKSMDLLWPNPDVPGGLLGFRGVVRPRFGRADLPSQLQGYFAFADEVANRDVKTVVERATLMSSLSIVWRIESGELVGFKDVVSPNISVGKLPDELKDVILTEADAEKLGPVCWLPLKEPYNPTYKKSSQSFGVGAEQSAGDVLALKKKVWEGNNCGLAWHGHTGKFTDDFKGGAYRNSSFNTSTVKPRW